MGNKNSSSKSKVHGKKASKVASTEPHHVPIMQRKPSTNPNMVGFSASTQQGHGTKGSSTINALLRDEYIGNVVGVHSESEQQYYEAPLVDNDDTFTDFIRRAKYRIRTFTMSNVDREQQSNSTPPAPAPDEAYGSSNSKENQEDQFSEFIQLAKKRLRTTSSIGNNGSLKRG